MNERVLIPGEEAQTRLQELFAKLAPGQEVILTQNQRPVAKLVSERPARPPRPEPGLSHPVITTPEAVGSLLMSR